MIEEDQVLVDSSEDSAPAVEEVSSEPASVKDDDDSDGLISNVVGATALAANDSVAPNPEILVDDEPSDEVLQEVSLTCLLDCCIVFDKWFLLTGLAFDRH